MSRKFEGCYYEFSKRIGQGGSAEVYTVLLRDLKTDKVENLYAGKVVLESWLLNKNTRKRRENLRREIEILKLTDMATNVTLVEKFKTVEGTVLIQDYVNGGSLLSIINARAAPLKETEV